MTERAIVVSGSKVKGNTDAKRVIVDLLFIPELPIRHSVMIVLAESAVGNHYHDCDEMFYLEKGVIRRFVWHNTKTGVQEEHFDLGPGTKITVPPGVAHALVMEPGSVLHMYVFSSQPPDNKDFFKPWNLIS